MSAALTTSLSATALFVFLRSAGLCMTVPVIGAPAVPMRFRMALAVVVAGLGYSALPAAPPIDAAVSSTLLLALAEVLIGVVGGLVPRVLLASLEGAGAAAGVAMGLGFHHDGQDPGSGAPASELGRAFAIAGLFFAVALGVHREAVLWLCWSMTAAPPGSASSMLRLAEAVVAQGVTSALLAFRLGFPIVAAVTTGHLVLAFLSKSAPQLNISSVGFSLAVVVGGLACWEALPVAAHAVATLALDALGAAR